MTTKGKVTLKSLAGKLNVTAATVSKALRGSSDISHEMQTKVKKLADELGYRPNLMARTLKFRRSFLLGAIIPDLRISFFSEVTRGIYEQARERGYVAILMVNDEKPDIERKNLEFLSDLRVDGILLDAAPGNQNREFFKQLVREEIPIVCYDRRLADLDVSSVSVDDREAAFKLTSKLIAEGRKDIMFLGPTTDFSVAIERYQGYVDALNHYQIPLNPELIVHTKLDSEESYITMKGVLDKGGRPDAVLSIGGTVAYGAGQAILQSGFVIPDDIVLAEFGDNDVISRLGIPFYTINQNPYKIGTTAVDLLVDEIENQEPEPVVKHVLVDTHLLHRKTATYTK